MTTTLAPALHAMGLKSREAQVGFVQLLQASGAFGPRLGVGVINDVQAASILDNVTFLDNQESLRWLHNATQNHFLRPPGLERHETKEPMFLRENRAEIEKALEKTGILHGAHTERKHVDYLVVPGSMESSARMRMMQVGKLYEQGLRFDHLVILGSERPLNPQLEHTLQGEAASHPTEAGMLKAVLNEERKNWPPELANMKAMLVETGPHADGSRANTRDTVEHWLRTRPEPGTVLAISEAPHQRYIKAVMESTLPQGFTVEMHGPGVNAGERNLAVALDAFARQLDAGMQNIAAHMAQEQNRDRITNHLSHIDPKTVKYDPDRFQFRLDALGNERGTSDGMNLPLDNPEVMNQPLLVWESKEKERFIIDGHHRLEYFQQQGAPTVNAQLLREVDGFTADDARIIGAYVNFHDMQRGGPDVDLRSAANVFHDVQYNRINTELLPALQRGEELEIAHRAGSLGEQAFMHVRDGRVPVEVGAAIASQTSDPDQQHELIKDAQVQLAQRSWEDRVRDRDNSPNNNLAI